MSERTKYAKEIALLLERTQLTLWEKLISALEFRYGKVQTVRCDSTLPLYEHVFEKEGNELCAVRAASNRLSFKITLSDNDKKEFEMHRETFSEKIQNAYDALPSSDRDGCVEVSVDSVNTLDSLVELVRIKEHEDKSLKGKFKKVLRFLLNPRLLLCLGIGWMITNGWSYILAFFGTVFQIKWMMAVSYSYLAFLWLPISPEKIVTVAIAIALLRFLFPKDQATLGILREMYAKIKNTVKKKKKDKEKNSKEKLK